MAEPTTAARTPFPSDVTALARIALDWVGLDAESIAARLAHELARRLALDAVVVRVCDPRGDRHHDAGVGVDILPADVRARISALLDGAPVEAPRLCADGQHSLSLRFGSPPCGGLVACSRRDDFPTEQERMLCDVAAGQIAIALHHMRSERRLADYGERLRVTLESIGEAVLSVDAGGRVEFANEVAERLLGIDAGEAIGRPVEHLLALVDARSRAPMPNPARRALDDGFAAAASGTFIDRRGDARALDCVASPLVAHDGGVAGAVLVCRDVTDLHRAEQLRARVEAEVELRRDMQLSAFQHAPSLMALLRGDDHVVELANARFRALLGDRELLGRPLAQAVPELASQGVVAMLEQVTREQRTLRRTEIRLSLRREDGGGSQEHWLELVLQPVPAVADRGTGILVHALDLTERVRAQRQLRERDARLALLLDNATDYGVIITDPDGRILEWLGGAERITGWPAAEAIGQPVAMIYVDTDRSAGVPEAELAEAQARGRAEDRRWHRRRDGSLFYADGVAMPLRDGDGQIRGFGKLFRDDSARQRAAVELQALSDESERRRRLYEAALSNTPDLVYVIDREHRFVYANEALLSNWGRRLEDAVGRGFVELGLPSASAEHLDRDIDRVLATAAPVRGEIVIGDTQVHEYIFAPVIGADGTVEAVAGTTRDVTDRKRSEERSARVAAASNAVNASLAVDCIAGIVAEQARGIVDARMAALALCDDDGRLQSPLATAGPLTVAAGPLPERLRRRLEDVCRSAQASRCAADDELPASLAVPLAGHGGRVLGVLHALDAAAGAFDDGDEAALAQFAAVAAAGIENARLYESLRLADQRKDEFLATLAHELRNPLAPMRYALEVMRGSPQRDDRERAREMIGRQLTQLVRLVDDLLDVARISTGKLQLRRERVDLAQVVRSAVETSQPAIMAAGQTLSVELPEAPLYLDADPTRLAQVLLNLLNNAAKYSEPGGRIALSATRECGQAEIRVRDSGIGIPAPLLRHVFELFSQIEHADRSQGGLGIGLTLVKRLVEMHGGTVEAHSEGRGRGSEFVIRLPLRARAQESSEPHPDGADAAAEAHRRVLVVDDNRDAASSLAFLLNAIGHRAEAAHDGGEALEAAARFRPDVVVLDIGMPGLDGYEVARRLRNMRDLRQPVLIALTGWGQEQDRRRSREAGFDHHLVKPADLGELKRLVAGGVHAQQERRGLSGG